MVDSDTLNELGAVIAKMSYIELAELADSVYKNSKDKALWMSRTFETIEQDEFYEQWVNDPTTSVQDVKNMLGV